MKKVFRPWGFFRVLLTDDKYWVKILMIKRGQRTSKQYHHEREEIHIVLSGEIVLSVKRLAETEISEKKKAGDYYVLRPFEVHRIENTGRGNASIAEIACGRPREADIVRLQDDYGRKCEPNKERG